MGREEGEKHDEVERKKEGEAEVEGRGEKNGEEKRQQLRRGKACIFRCSPSDSLPSTR